MCSYLNKTLHKLQSLIAFRFLLEGIMKYHVLTHVIGCTICCAKDGQIAAEHDVHSGDVRKYISLGRKGSQSRRGSKSIVIDSND